MNAAPGFYAERLGDRFVTHDELVSARLPRALAWLATRVALARGLALGWRARRGDRVAVIRREPGSLPALWVCALPPARPRLVVLELIRRPLPRAVWRRLAYLVWWRIVERPALRRGMERGQAMTAWERDELAAHYGVGRARIEHLPWALSERPGGSPGPVRDRAHAVFASGRTAPDWETLLSAADGAEWELTVVCAKPDAARVRRLAAGRADVRVEVPWAEHDRLLRAADVCVIAIADRGLSSGHVRLMAATEAGVPVIASDVRGLDGYAVAGRTAVLVPPGRPDAMRAAIDSLLADPGRRLALRDEALERARSWTYAQYFGRIAALVAGGRLPSPDPRPSG